MSRKEPANGWRTERRIEGIIAYCVPRDEPSVSNLDLKLKSSFTGLWNLTIHLRLDT